MKLRLSLLAVVGIALWFLPYGLGPYAIHVVDIAIIFALLAVGLGLAMGVAGQINLAQVAFFGVSAYAVAILTARAGFGFWTAAVLAMVATLATGMVVGIPALRMQSHYLGIVTLGLALAFTNWVTNAELSGGAEGLGGIPVPPMFGIDLFSEYLYYYLELMVFAIALGFGMFVVRTRIGRRMRAMRDDALAAGAVGVEIPRLRMLAFAIASVYGGLAGVLYAGLIRYVAPETFSLANMFLLLAMVIIGGRQSLLGCVVGAVGLTLVREALVEFATYAQLAFGAVVVLMVVFAPTGLAGIPARVRRRFSRGQSALARAQLQPFAPSDVGDSRPESLAEPPPDLVASDLVASDLVAQRTSVARTGAEQAEAAARMILEVAKVTMRFRGLTALDGVSLAVREGEIRGIVGPNGSGKTTLFNIVSGLYRATAGKVAFDGEVVSRKRPYELSLLGVARTFQNLRLFATMTVRENVLVALDRSRTAWAWRYPLWPVGVWRGDAWLRAEADRLLAAYGLSEFADVLPSALPYGIQRRVEIARAMAGRPRLLLLDEPAAGLNADEVEQLATIVRAIRASGVTVVVIEHNMGLVMSLCEQITVLASGRVIAEGTPAQVVADTAVIEAYLGDARMLEAMT
ncbi:MAG TPA: branched-chain amino acid ABC transporter ATP-binding protein/permease [Candidatus Limnocylindrales bacterium]|nr:branched-chain amino acid ABC transporter ATP-binding protein/permease [Candidatus Limnocylindrales bacterium]